MLLPALLCRLRSCAAFSLVLSLLMLAALSTAHAQQPPPSHVWQVTYTNSSTNYAYTANGGNSTPVSSAWPAGNNGYSLGNYGYINSSVNGTVTATLTWVPATGKTLATDPPSEPVYITETATASEQSNWLKGGTAPDAGSVDDGLGDAAVAAGTSTVSKTAKGVHLLQRDGSSGTIVLPAVTLSAFSPTSTKSNGNFDWINSYASVSLSVAVTNWTVNLNLTGTTPDSSGNPNILIGQGCTASLSGMGCTVSGPYQWIIDGSKFQDYAVTYAVNSSSTAVRTPVPSPLNQATAHWYWSDSAGNKTVSCTATVTPTGQSALQVTATKIVNLREPDYQVTIRSGRVQINNLSQGAYGPGYTLYAGPDPNTGATRGIDWIVQVNTPALFSSQGGSLWHYVQIISPGSWYTPDGGTQQPGSPYDGQTGLDGFYPYYPSPYSASFPGGFSADNSPYTAGDSPGVKLANTNSNYYVNEHFNTYVMYNPPGSDTRWVPLHKIAWYWTANVTRPGASWSGWPNATTAGSVLSPASAREITHPQWTLLVH